MIDLIIRSLANWTYRSKSILTYTLRPGNLDYYDSCLTTPKIDFNKIAIVLQGPLTKDSYTLDTIKFYRIHFPQIWIILSTWDDQNTDQFNELRDNKLKILKSKLPENKGPFNINLQIYSSNQGIQLAKKLKCKYVAKTRTDQRIFSPNWIEFMLGIINTFPVKDSGIQKERLIVSSLNTYKYRYFSISDMFMFGLVSDMLYYWDSELDTRTQRDKVKPKQTIKIWCQERYGEVYLMTNYLSKIGQKYKFTLSDYWKILTLRFCIVDQQSVQQHWHKYGIISEYRGKVLGKERNDQEMRFSDWISWFALGLPKHTSKIQTKHNLSPFKEVIKLQ